MRRRMSARPMSRDHAAGYQALRTYSAIVSPPGRAPCPAAIEDDVPARTPLRTLTQAPWAVDAGAVCAISSIEPRGLRKFCGDAAALVLRDGRFAASSG